ncbi:MAG: PAS domain S-box protein [Gemmatimonadetes bacterium]|nr:PAS domain S-box protein [Gemmatimonadota bacterium]
MKDGSRDGEAPRAVGLGRQRLLRWLYLGRVTLVTGIFAGALLAWAGAGPARTLIATVMFILAAGVTAWSFWYTHWMGREPGENFLYAQVVFDALVVTGVVHITGGGESDFAPLYILVISAGALLLPLRGGVLVGGLASILFFADAVWGHAATLSATVFLQIGLFALVAVATGYLGDRLRRAGIALGAVESELRRLRLDTGDILRNIATGVITVDGAGRLAYMNPAAEHLLGVSYSQWTGASVLEVLEQASPGLGSAIRHTLAERRPVMRRKTLARRLGQELILGVSTTVLDREDGAPPSVTVIFQDITDTERLEALHRRAERLEAVAELSASLAHEIKNPLASIRSAVDQLTTSRSLDRDDQGALQRLVLGESDRLSRLLSEFIEFARVRPAAQEEVDLRDVVRDALGVVRQHPDAAAGVRLTVSLGARRIPVRGDADLLHRAVFNLVLNAVQFAGEKGEVDVTLERIHPSALPSGIELRDPVRLRVRDTGPGIDPAAVPRIFDPFYTTRPGGSGLGLAVVHRAVEAHEGAVIVDPGPGRGAEFTIFLSSTTDSHG